MNLYCKHNIGGTSTFRWLISGVGKKIFLNLQCKQDIGGNITFHVCMYYFQTSSNTNWDRYHSWNWSRVCEHFFSKIQYTLKSNDNREEIWCTLFGTGYFQNMSLFFCCYTIQTLSATGFFADHSAITVITVYMVKADTYLQKIYKHIHGQKNPFSSIIADKCTQI